MSCFDGGERVITLFVHDLARSMEFYERVFEVAPADEEEGTVIFEVDNLLLRLLRANAQGSFVHAAERAQRREPRRQAHVPGT